MRFINSEVEGISVLIRMLRAGDLFMSPMYIDFSGDKTFVHGMRIKNVRETEAQGMEKKVEDSIVSLNRKSKDFSSKVMDLEMDLVELVKMIKMKQSISNMPHLRLKLHEFEQNMRFVNSEVEGITILTRMLRRGSEHRLTDPSSSSSSDSVSRPKSQRSMIFDDSEEFYPIPYGPSSEELSAVIG